MRLSGPLLLFTGKISIKGYKKLLGFPAYCATAGDIDGFDRQGQSVGEFIVLGV
jgi:hypothetical protein